MLQRTPIGSRDGVRAGRPPARAGGCFRMEGRGSLPTGKNRARAVVQLPPPGGSPVAWTAGWRAIIWSAAASPAPSASEAAVEFETARIQLTSPGRIGGGRRRWTGQIRWGIRLQKATQRASMADSQRTIPRPSGGDPEVSQVLVGARCHPPAAIVAAQYHASSCADRPVGPSRHQHKDGIAVAVRVQLAGQYELLNGAMPQDNGAVLGYRLCHVVPTDDCCERKDAAGRALRSKIAIPSRGSVRGGAGHHVLMVVGGTVGRQMFLELRHSAVWKSTHARCITRSIAPPPPVPVHELDASYRERAASLLCHLRRLAPISRGAAGRAVLLFRGAVRDRHDRRKWHSEQGPLSVTGVKFMNWHTGQGGGGAIDLVMHLADVDFRTALAWLEEHLAASRAARP